MKPEPIPSKTAWELEYQNPQLLTRGDEPTKEFRDFVTWLHKEEQINLEGAHVLDVGCGTGRNVLYIAGAARIHGVGMDISQQALHIARQRAENSDMTWRQHDLEQALPEGLGLFDVVIDSTTSHLLPRLARERLVQDIAQHMTPGGYLYVRTLTSDGDRNARNLIRELPGPEADSYVHPQLGVAEYMLSQTDLMALYEPYFAVRHVRKYTGYQKWGVQSYKRRYVTLYLQKPHE